MRVKHLFKSHKILGAPLHQQKIEKGLESRDVLSMNQKSSIRNDWDTTNTKALAQRRVVTLGGMGVCGHLVQPCHVWRLYQLEGQAGYTTKKVKMNFSLNIQNILETKH